MAIALNGLNDFLNSGLYSLKMYRDGSSVVAKLESKFLPTLTYCDSTFLKLMETVEANLGLPQQMHVPNYASSGRKSPFDSAFADNMEVQIHSGKFIPFDSIVDMNRYREVCNSASEALHIWTRPKETLRTRLGTTTPINSTRVLMAHAHNESNRIEELLNYQSKLFWLAYDVPKYDDIMRN